MAPRWHNLRHRMEHSIDWKPWMFPMRSIKICKQCDKCMIDGPTLYSAHFDPSFLLKQTFKIMLVTASISTINLYEVANIFSFHFARQYDFLYLIGLNLWDPIFIYELFCMHQGMVTQALVRGQRTFKTEICSRHWNPKFCYLWRLIVNSAAINPFKLVADWC